MNEDEAALVDAVTKDRQDRLTRIINEIASLPPGYINDEDLARAVAIQRVRNEISNIQSWMSLGRGSVLHTKTPEEEQQSADIRNRDLEKIRVLQDKLRIMLLDDYGAGRPERVGLALK